MSSLYNLEPQPTAKVILQTTSGDLSIELFGKQTPLASRNFLQHCLDGYYTGSIFHRLVPGFIVQGGDPTGTGSGGISAISDGEPFQDEFHSRLKFNRRGLLGMANEGKDSNGSQFFFTLGATPELQGKHTMFGRIEGDTIYNLMKLGETELVGGEGEGSETPLYPVRVTGAEVVVNPFEDMVARAREAPRTRVDDDGREKVKKRKKPAGKNVLSFGGEEGDEEAAAPVLKKAKANPKLVSAGTEEPEKLNNTTLPEAPREKKARRHRSPSPAVISERQATELKKPAARKAAEASRSPTSSPEPEQITKTNKLLDATNAEIAALKASMKRNVDVAPKQQDQPKSALEALIPASSTRGRKRGKASDEKGALDIFKAFKTRLDGLPVAGEQFTDSMPSRPTNGHDPDTAPTGPSTAAGGIGTEDDEANLCDLHFIANCQSCRSWGDDQKPDPEAEADGEGGAAWMSHQLSFAKDKMGKDLTWRKKLEEISVIDPREKPKTIKEERKKVGSDGKTKGKIKP
ncbi:Peptidyl-prolyl isomerase cwc27 [Vermiconidia calcicola]|uniref:Peptidyl-prolyl isomerase cwc27 n=1 Tax=Vermiconidia calcicola TaxID=1690605 RepID=A0ACC3NH25_9PEZI|nr:Peptidyl-prolyl isomerase cwc27 [Vermiconidia calcicola]